MNFEHSDEQRQLADAVTRFLARDHGFEQRKAIRSRWKTRFVVRSSWSTSSSIACRSSRVSSAAAGLVLIVSTPPAIVAKWNADVAKILNSPDVRAKIVADGAEPSPNTPEQASHPARSCSLRRPVPITPLCRRSK